MTNRTNNNWPWWKAVLAIIAFLATALYAACKILEAAANGALR